MHGDVLEQIRVMQDTGDPGIAKRQQACATRPQQRRVAQEKQFIAQALLADQQQPLTGQIRRQMFIKRQAGGHHLAALRAPLIMPPTLGKLAHAQAQHTERQMRIGILRHAGKHLLIPLQCRRVITLLGAHPGEIQQRVGKPGIHLQRTQAAIGGFFQSALRPQHLGEIAQGMNAARIYRQRLVIARCSFVELAQIFKHHVVIVTGIEIHGIGPQRFGVGLRGFVKPPLPLQQRATVVQRVR